MRLETCRVFCESNPGQLVLVMGRMQQGRMGKRGKGVCNTHVHPPGHAPASRHDSGVLGSVGSLERSLGDHQSPVNGLHARRLGRNLLDKALRG